ncbi:MAG: S-methyl-5-thioribose-1-phosphate isomerase [Candidatus Cloacimonetes bacterium]|nr:S-methyl-5-thioribose-1-phosphate isomerase [Candidatus Cloacimonadota bacterium]
MDVFSIKRFDDKFKILDQTLLPLEEKYLLIDDYKDMIEAIKQLKIRGAPAIGIAGIAATYLAGKKYLNETDFKKKMLVAMSEIENSRPTAVNLFHAIEKVRDILLIQNDSNKFNQNTILCEINKLVDELMQYEYEACQKMAINGFDYIPKHINRFLTHCNTGSLATYGSGTALGVIKEIAKHREIEVYVDETRPLFQGSRLTMWELQKSDINCTLITDNMAAWTIKTKNIQAIITGADRIAQNGDTANKIGTLNLALLANHFAIPFYIVAPESTFDKKINSGKDIVIEERDCEEVSFFKGVSLTPKCIKVFNPAFDVTNRDLISAIITDQKVYDNGG